jgi:hypothetical protein
MKNLELRRFKKAIGAITFGLFFPNENRRLNQKQGIGKQPDLVLVFVPQGKQSVTVSYLRDLTGWTVKKATAFVKEGEYPKVVDFNLNTNPKSDYYQTVLKYQEELEVKHGVILKIY